MVFVEYKLFILFQCFHDIASWTKLTFKLFNCLKLLIFKRRQIPQNAFDGHFAAWKSCKTILLHLLGKTFQTSWCTRFLLKSYNFQQLNAKNGTSYNMFIPNIMVNIQGQRQNWLSLACECLMRKCLRRLYFNLAL